MGHTDVLHIELGCQVSVKYLHVVLEAVRIVVTPLLHSSLTRLNFVGGY